MISSTRSSESASRSSWNEASSVISFASTPSCSTSTSLTLSAISSREAAISFSYLPFVQGPGGTADATTLPGCRRNSVREACAKALDHPAGRALGAQRDRVSDRLPGTVPVRDHGERAKPEKISAAVRVRIEALAQATRRRPDEQPADLSARRRADLGAKLLQEGLD